MADSFAMGHDYLLLDEVGAAVLKFELIDIEFARSSSNIKGIPIQIHAADKLDIRSSFHFLGLQGKIILVPQLHII